MKKLDFQKDLMSDPDISFYQKILPRQKFLNKISEKLVSKRAKHSK